MSQGKHVDLGFGCMRLPLLRADQPESFDYEKIERLFDVFLKKGFTYFDTAYTYHGYHGEEAVRKALVERHPRSSFELATKLPLRDFKDEQDLERIFKEQLDHCGTEYFDYYLLHNMVPMYMRSVKSMMPLVLLLERRRRAKSARSACRSMICRSFWMRFSRNMEICWTSSSFR